MGIKKSSIFGIASGIKDIACEYNRIGKNNQRRHLQNDLQLISFVEVGLISKTPRAGIIRPYSSPLRVELKNPWERKLEI
ncbi:hypothetical protein [Microseira wollei]|uniref:hypothetical protein n=1 Tax=Microseira wollei TaxID=467598 RepID=UPI001CFF42CB|nr:hypothetical protein [Microseira wollei]